MVVAPRTAKNVGTDHRVITTDHARHRGSQSEAGRGLLEVVRSGATSVATRVRATSPLKLLTPRNNGGAAWVYASTYGGGLVDGDALDLTVDVGAGAMALISTQASTKVYRSPAGTRSDLTVRVAADGTLVSIPDPVVCFANARYRQRQEIDLAVTASLVHVDWLSCGRRARGEHWMFDEYSTSLALRRAGRLLCYDALTLSAAEGPLSDRLGRFEAIGMVVIAGPMFEVHTRELLGRSCAQEQIRRADLLQVVSPIAGDAGCLVRVAGVSLDVVSRAIRQSLDFLPAVLGDDPWARKW